jgi:glycosyltransferase involved in cell wall biosynthesis
MKNPILKKFVDFLKPDLILTQTYESNEFFSKANCKTKFLPNGVDVERFKPISLKTKEELRKKYKIPKEKFVVLHVGHIKKARGLEIFTKIQKIVRDIQVIIVSSSYFKKDRKLYQKLKESGCIIWDQYFENIEEIYQISDCYLFPVKRGNSIFMPLSILEAMSCNLPVISTKFEGLDTIFKQGDGLFFAESEEEFYDALEKIGRDMNIKTREKVLPYSWENVIERLEEIYYKISEQ